MYGQQYQGNPNPTQYNSLILIKGIKVLQRLLLEDGDMFDLLFDFFFSLYSLIS